MLGFVKKTWDKTKRLLTAENVNKAVKVTGALAIGAAFLAAAYMGFFIVLTALIVVPELIWPFMGILAFSTATSVLVVGGLCKLFPPKDSAVKAAPKMAPVISTPAFQIKSPAADFGQAAEIKNDVAIVKTNVPAPKTPG